MPQCEFRYKWIKKEWSVLGLFEIGRNVNTTTKLKLEPQDEIENTLCSRSKDAVVEVGQSWDWRVLRVSEDWNLFWEMCVCMCVWVGWFYGWYISRGCLDGAGVVGSTWDILNPGFFLSIGLIGFPKRLPATKQHRAKQRWCTSQGGGEWLQG